MNNPVTTAQIRESLIMTEEQVEDFKTGILYGMTRDRSLELLDDAFKVLEKEWATDPQNKKEWDKFNTFDKWLYVGSIMYSAGFADGLGVFQCAVEQVVEEWEGKE